MNRERNKIDVDKIDLEKHKEKTIEQPGIAELAHHVGSAIIKPEDRGKIKGRALSAMYDQTDNQLTQIYEQMQLLARQAKAIQERVEISERIYKSKISFNPIIGKTYYLYEHKNGSDVLSMISPQEWGKSMPYAHFRASVTLLADHTWDVNSNGVDR